VADAAGDELAAFAGVAEAGWLLAELLVDAHPAASATVHSRAAAAPARRAAGADGVMGGIPYRSGGHWLVPRGVLTVTTRAPASWLRPTPGEEAPRPRARFARLVAPGT
jgi:hypothetical protein